MMRVGVNVSVGTDGSTTNNSLDMFGEIKTLGLLQKSSRWDPSILRAQQLLDFATIAGAKAIGLESSIGSIEVGKRADIVIMDGKAPNLNPLRPENLISNVVYSSSCQNVRTVICEGRLIMKDWMVLTLDDEKVVGAALDSARELMS
jgi:5-methylthioadenosine/S-adenosylhomocysteine deaminase